MQEYRSKEITVENVNAFCVAAAVAGSANLGNSSQVLDKGSHIEVYDRTMPGDDSYVYGETPLTHGAEPDIRVYDMGNSTYRIEFSAKVPAASVDSVKTLIESLF